MKSIPYGKQSITNEDVASVVEAVTSAFITQGPRLTQFEEYVAKEHHAKYGVAFSNGTAALHAAYWALNVEKGMEFITTPITFVASANGGLYNGLLPKFVDIDKKTNCIDVSQIEDAITDKTRVITPVSYAGYPVDLKSIREIADRHNCCIIHDAAHAIGSRRAGTFGMEYADMAILSFHPVKHITTGEGGMVLTNNSDLYERLKLFRSHGITKDLSVMEKNDGPWYYEMHDLGFNYRMTDIQAALGLSQMARLFRNLKERNCTAKRYNDAFEGNDYFDLPPNLGFEINNKNSFSEVSDVHSYHLYTIKLKDASDRKRMYEYLQEKGIRVQIHYIPVHLQPYYKKNYGYGDGDFPLAEDFYQKEMSLPMFHNMDQDDLEYVIDTVKEFR